MARRASEDLLMRRGEPERCKRLGSGRLTALPLGVSQSAIWAVQTAYSNGSCATLPIRTPPMRTAKQ